MSSTRKLVSYQLILVVSIFFDNLDDTTIYTYRRKSLVLVVEPSKHQDSGATFHADVHLQLSLKYFLPSLRVFYFPLFLLFGVDYL
jgi:hypothetical protein